MAINVPGNTAAERAVNAARLAQVAKQAGWLGTSEGDLSLAATLNATNAGRYVTTHPRDNTPNGVWQSWCAAFQSAMWGTDVNDSTMAKSWLKIGQEIPSNAVKPGDVVVFNRDNNPRLGHVGVVRAVNRDGTFSTIEGNAGDENGQDGVVSNTYSPDNARIAGFRRVGDFTDAALDAYQAPSYRDDAYGMPPTADVAPRPPGAIPFAPDFGSTDIAPVAPVERAPLAPSVDQMAAPGFNFSRAFGAMPASDIGSLTGGLAPAAADTGTTSPTQARDLANYRVPAERDSAYSTAPAAEPDGWGQGTAVAPQGDFSLGSDQSFRTAPQEVAPSGFAKTPEIVSESPGFSYDPTTAFGLGMTTPTMSAVTTAIAAKAAEDKQNAELAAAYKAPNPRDDLYSVAPVAPVVAAVPADVPAPEAVPVAAPPAAPMARPKLPALPAPTVIRTAPQPPQERAPVSPADALRDRFGSPSQFMSTGDPKAFATGIAALGSLTGDQGLGTWGSPSILNDQRLGGAAWNHLMSSYADATGQAGPKGILSAFMSDTGIGGLADSVGSAYGDVKDALSHPFSTIGNALGLNTDSRITNSGRDTSWQALGLQPVAGVDNSGFSGGLDRSQPQQNWLGSLAGYMGFGGGSGNYSGPIGAGTGGLW